MTDTPPDDLLPCPFCGGEASVSTYETESLWSHNIVTYTRVGCSECDIAFNTEPGYEVEAPEAWNTRAKGITATDTPPDNLVPLLKAMAASYHDGHMWDHLDREAVTRAAARVAELEAALIQHNDRLRSAVSIAEREGKDTNWLAFRGNCHYTLAEYHELVNGCRAALKPPAS
jgi:Lar family restriction alleviation protein